MSGNAKTIVVVIVVIIALGVAGFMGYKSFAKKSAPSQQGTPSDAQAPAKAGGVDAGGVSPSAPGAPPPPPDAGAAPN
jgi:hypothetical protein